MKLLLIFLFTSLFFACVDDQKSLIQTQNSSDVEDNKLKKEKLVESYINLATDALYKKDFPTAYDNLFKAEAINENNIDVLNLLGLIYFYDDNIDVAEEKFKKALKINPKYSEAHNHLGIVYSKKGDYSNAIKEYKAAVSNLLYKTPWVAYINMSETYILMNDFSNAKDAALKAIKKNANQCRGYFILGTIYEKEADFEKSLTSFKDASVKCPNDAEIYFKIGLLFAQQKDNINALENFKKCNKFATETNLTNLIKECGDYIKLLGE